MTVARRNHPKAAAATAGSAATTAKNDQGLGVGVGVAVEVYSSPCACRMNALKSSALVSEPVYGLPLTSTSSALVILETSEFGMGPPSARSLAVVTQLLKRPSSMHESISPAREEPAASTRFFSTWSLRPGPPSAG